MYARMVGSFGKSVKMAYEAVEIVIVRVWLEPESMFCSHSQGVYEVNCRAIVVSTRKAGVRNPVTSWPSNPPCLVPLGVLEHGPRYTWPGFGIGLGFLPSIFDLPYIFTVSIKLSNFMGRIRHLSYAVAPRKDSDRPTTKPRIVKRMLPTATSKNSSLTWT